MAWRRPGDKPLSEPMIVCLLTHICVTRPQWVKKKLTYVLVSIDLTWVSCSKHWCHLNEISRFWHVYREGLMKLRYNETRLSVNEFNWEILTHVFVRKLLVQHVQICVALNTQLSRIYCGKLETKSKKSKPVTILILIVRALTEVQSSYELLRFCMK